MEWVETTGRTLEEAKEAALDQLGVAAEDAEFDVVEEARSGLFGRVRQEARVRARVRPTSPRPKADRRDRRRKAPEGQGAEAGSEAERGGDDSGEAAPEPAKAAGTRARGGRRAAPKVTSPDVAPAVEVPAAPEVEVSAADVTTDVVGEGATARPQRGGRTRSAAVTAEVKEEATNGAAARRRGANEMDDEPTLAEQRETVKEFLEGLVDAFGATATTEVDEVDEDTLEARVVGDDLGLLIGPKGATLQAVQEITRTVVQRAAEPGRGARVRIDIGGYREHRREALSRFTTQICEQVLSSGDAVALEAMSAPDRKVVHDTVNDIEGVSSSSEGDDPDRRVVIRPE